MPKTQNHPPRGMERFIRYKWVYLDGKALFTDFYWPLKKSKWLPRITGKLIRCVNGYHTPKPNQTNTWYWREMCDPSTLLMVEVADPLLNSESYNDKQVWRYARVLENLGELKRKQVRALDYGDPNATP